MTTYENSVTEARMISTAAASLKDKLPREIVWLSKSCFPQKVDSKLGEVRDMILAAKELGVEDLQGVDFDKIPAEIQADLVAKISAMRHLEMANWITFMIYVTLGKLGVPEHYYVSAPIEPAAPSPQ